MPEDKESEVTTGRVDFSKRAFIKTALIGGIAVASGAMIAKKIASNNASNAGVAHAFVDDDLQQELVMKGKEFIVMTREEKDSMIDMFVGEYSYKA